MTDQGAACRGRLSRLPNSATGRCCQAVSRQVATSQRFETVVRKRYRQHRAGSAPGAQNEKQAWPWVSLAFDMGQMHHHAACTIGSRRQKANAAARSHARCMPDKCTVHRSEELRTGGGGHTIGRQSMCGGCAQALWKPPPLPIRQMRRLRHTQRHTLTHMRLHTNTQTRAHTRMCHCGAHVRIISCCAAEQTPAAKRAQLRLGVMARRTSPTLKTSPSCHTCKGTPASSSPSSHHHKLHTGRMLMPHHKACTHIAVT